MKKHESLNPVPTIISAINDRNLTYCHWKSNVRLQESYQGHTDLDILVSKSDYRQFRNLLQQTGYVALRDNNPAPGIEHWLGFDESLQVMLHIHLHTEIWTGRQFVKEFRLPWQDRILSSRVWNEPFRVYVTCPNLEYVLLLIRVTLKSSEKPSSEHRTCLPEDIQAEFHYLMPLCNPTQLEAYLQTLFDLSSEQARRCLAAAELPSAVDLFELQTLLTPSLQCHRRMSSRRAQLKSAASKLRRRAGKYLQRRGAGFLSGKPIEGKGIALAFVGCDGAGKSTVCDLTHKWAAYKFSVQHLYLGSGLATWPIVQKLRRPKANSTRHSFKNQNAKSEENNSRRRGGLAFPLFAVALAFEKFFKLTLARMLVNTGRIVIMDRFPQQEVLGIYDGPRLQILPTESLFYTSLRHLEAWLFHSSVKFRCDLLVRLTLPPEVAMARKPEEDPGLVKRKAELTSQLRFNTKTDLTIQTDQPLEEVFQQIKGAFWKELTGEPA